jgi:hypothetical protein
LARIITTLITFSLSLVSHLQRSVLHHIDTAARRNVTDATASAYTVLVGAGARAPHIASTEALRYSESTRAAERGSDDTEAEFIAGDLGRVGRP